MATFNDCVPGLSVRILGSGVARVRGKTGVIVEVTRGRRGGEPLIERVTVDIAGHGEIAVAPVDVELLSD